MELRRLGLAGFALLSPWLLALTEFATVRAQEPLVLYRSYLWMSVLPAALPAVTARLATTPRPTAIFSRELTEARREAAIRSVPTLATHREGEVLVAPGQRWTWRPLGDHGLGWQQIPAAPASFRSRKVCGGLPTAA